MPRPSTRLTSPLTRGARAAILAALTLVGSLPTSPASAGPIAESYKQWSMRRQTQTQVEKPFSHQSSQVATGQPSALQRLRARLTSKSKVDTTTHQMTTTPIHLNQGTLYR